MNSETFNINWRYILAETSTLSQFTITIMYTVFYKLRFILSATKQPISQVCCVLSWVKWIDYVLTTHFYWHCLYKHKQWNYWYQLQSHSGHNINLMLIYGDYHTVFYKLLFFSQCSKTLRFVMLYLKSSELEYVKLLMTLYWHCQYYLSSENIEINYRHILAETWTLCQSMVTTVQYSTSYKYFSCSKTA